MLNNKTVRIWCHFLDHNRIFVFQAIFLRCQCIVAQKGFTNQTLRVLCVIEFHLPFVNQKHSLKVFSGDFLLTFVL